MKFKAWAVMYDDKKYVTEIYVSRKDAVGAYRLSLVKTHLYPAVVTVKLPRKKKTK